MGDDSSFMINLCRSKSTFRSVSKFAFAAIEDMRKSNTGLVRVAGAQFRADLTAAMRCWPSGGQYLRASRFGCFCWWLCCGWLLDGMRLGAEAADLFDLAEFSSLSRALLSENTLFGPRCCFDTGSGLISDMSKYLLDPLSVSAGWDLLGRKFVVLMVGCPACVLVAGRATSGDIFRFGAVGLLTSGCGVFIPRLLDCRSRSCHGWPAGSFCRRWRALLRGAGGEGARIFAGSS